MRVYVCKGARGSRMALGGMVGKGEERRKESRGEGEEWRPLGSVAETPFALSRGGLFFAAHKMAAAPTRLLHLVRGCRGLEFSPSCSLYTIFVRSFVRSLARAASPSPLPTPLLAYTTSPLSLSLSDRPGSINPLQLCHPSLLLGRSPLPPYF